MSEEILNAARETLALDIWPIPIGSKGKVPIGKKWQERRIAIDEIPKHFPNGEGLGWLLGIRPRPIGDVDIDSAECLAVLPHIPLPATGRVFGRKSARSAHWEYEFPDAFDVAQFRDPVRKKANKGKDKDEKLKDMLVELRGAGQQTVVPPTPWFSANGEGTEPREWEKQGQFGKPRREELVARMARLATAGLLLRYTTASFEEPMALAGIFAAAGLPEDDAVEILSGVWRVARKEAVEQCKHDVRSTYRLVERNEHTFGYSHYAEMVSEDSAHFIIDEIYEWLGLKRPARSSDGFVRGDNDKLLPILANAVTMLERAPEWQGVVGFNEFSLRTEVRKPAPFPRATDPDWTDADDSQTAIWLQHHGVICNSRIANEAVQTVARKHAFHPVKEYFEGVAAAWDKAPRLDMMLVTYAGVEDSAYARVVSKCWMISAVARIYQPGCQADYTLILEGKQGKLKSKFFFTLAVRPEWFSDHISDLHSKDARLELHGKVIMELAELSAVRQTSDVERYKAFLTARADNFRAPYERRTQNVPRTNVFAGTTNNAAPFTDETGNRRFWPVAINLIDIDGLEKFRDQLWGEAVTRFKNKENWWFQTEALEAAAEEQQDQRYEAGVLDGDILRWAENPVQRCEEKWDSNARAKVPVPVEPFDSKKDAILIRDVLIHAIGKELKDLTDRDRKAVAKCLIRAGWLQHPVKIDGVTMRVYFRNPEVIRAALGLKV